MKLAPRHVAASIRTLIPTIRKEMLRTWVRGLPPGRASVALEEPCSGIAAPHLIENMSRVRELNRRICIRLGGEIFNGYGLFYDGSHA